MEQHLLSVHLPGSPMALSYPIGICPIKVALMPTSLSSHEGVKGRLCVTSSSHNKNKSSNQNHVHKGTHLVAHSQLPHGIECHLGSSIPGEAAA